MFSRPMSLCVRGVSRVVTVSAFARPAAAVATTAESTMTTSRRYQREMSSSKPDHEGLIQWIEDEKVRKFVHYLLEEKDQRINEILSSNDKLVDEKNQRLEEKDTQYRERIKLLEERVLGVQGLLTSRG